MPQRKENAFIVRHYAGRVKYQVIYFLFNCTLLIVLLVVKYSD